MLRNTTSTIKQRLGQRSIFTVPQLNSTHGIPASIYSTEGFNVVWNQYQKFLSEKLTYATQGTQLESLLPLQLVLKTSKEPFNSKVFNYASGLHSNHLFIENILPAAKLNEGNKNNSSVETAEQSLIVRKLQDSYGLEWTDLKKIIKDSEEKIMGQGYIFIVEDMNKKIDILYANNYGSPYYKPRQQLFDLNGGALKNNDYVNYYKLKTAVSAPKSNALSAEDKDNNKMVELKDFSLPLVAINLWDYAFLKDYGSDGRSKYLEKVLDNLNWNVINKRLFTH